MTAPVVPVTPEPLAADTLKRARPASLWRDTLGNILRQRSAVIGLVILAVFLFVGVFAPLIAPFDPDSSLLGKEQGVEKRAAPCIHLLGCPEDKPQHLFGTDGNFRDLFSRVIYGTRISLPIGFAAVTMAIIVGTLIGAIAGYVGGATDNVLMRLMDVVLAFPSLLLAIAIVTALGSSYFNALIAITTVSIPVYARIVRSSVLSTRENDYVVASRALGESPIGVLTRRVLPNAMTPLVVQATLGIGTAVLEIAALSFVGAAPLGAAEWGSMVAVERGQLLNAPHVVLIPGMAITLAVLGFNLLGDGLRDALDPRLNR
jgi:peptide/nickel transport system permease protein